MRRKYIVSGVAIGCAGLIAVGVWAYAGFSEARMLDEGIVAMKNGDYPRAIAVLSPLSDSGNRAARDSLGFLYAFGLGVSRDQQRAVALFVASGSSNLPERYFLIGQELEEGKNVARDKSEAKAWFKLAAEAGHLQARARLAASK
jgi:TPR repeat protein